MDYRGRQRQRVYDNLYKTEISTSLLEGCINPPGVESNEKFRHLGVFQTNVIGSDNEEGKEGEKGKRGEEGDEAEKDKKGKTRKRPYTKHIVLQFCDWFLDSSEEDIKARFLHSTPQGDKSTASPVEADDLISHSYITGLVVNISFSLPFY